MGDELIEALENAPVNSDASALRETPYPTTHHTIPGTQCSRCGTGEVYQPGQTLDMPMLSRCLRCGLSAKSEGFKQ